MPDSVDVVEAERNKGDIESVIQAWLDDNGGVTSVDDVELILRGRNKVLVAIVYTS